MSGFSIPLIRLASHQLTEATSTTPEDVVSRMGAIQAQDYNMAKWAIGIRLPGSTNELVEEAINRGDILRTHVLRPTWHFVAAKDIHWMLRLTAPRIKSAVGSRDKDLGLNEYIFDQCNTIIGKILEGNNFLTREEIAGILEKEGIKTDNYRISHIVFRAELDGLICSGPLKGKKQTYALLEERVPNVKALNKEESLEKLARAYFTSHCPATLQDFGWWSSLSITEMRLAMEMIKDDFVSEKIDSQIYWIANSFAGSIPEPTSKSVHLLPAFDEFLISYRDRKAVLPFENHTKAISSNGIFRPVIVDNGQAIGIWKKSEAKNKTIIEPVFFGKPDKETLNLIEQQAGIFNCFWSRQNELILAF